MRQKLLLHLSIIAGLTFLIWQKTINQGLWGDGFYFFNPLLRIGLFEHFPPAIKLEIYNIGARFIYDIIIPIFRDEMRAYQLFQIVFLAILSIFVYIATIRLTLNKLIAFITSIIFLSNWGGIYEMMAEGNLNRFLDRVPNLLLPVLGIYFLAKFFQDNDQKALVVSYLLYTIGIILGHFASFIMPFYVFFPIIYAFDSRKIAKSLMVGISIAVLFAPTNFIVIRNSDQRSSLSLSYYLNPDNKFVEKTFMMITPLAVPKELVINAAKNWPGGHIPNPYVDLVKFYTAILILSSVLIGYFLYNKNKNFFRIYLTCVLTIVAGTALMIITDPVKYDPFKNFGAGRHLFIQSIFFAIALSLFIVVFSQRFKKLSLVIPLIFTLVFAVYNTILSWKDIDSTQYLYEGNRKYISYIKSLYPQFNSNTVVVVGPHLLSPSQFINYFYGPPYIQIISDPLDIKKLKNKNKADIFVIDLDYQPTDEGVYLSDRGKIMDLTKEFRKGKIDLINQGIKPGHYFVNKIF